MKKLLVLLAPALLSATCFAQSQFTVNITVDETGHGLFTNSFDFSSALPSSVVKDPGPGGLAHALTYGLLNPPGLVSGDVFLREATSSSSEGSIQDVLRFNGEPGTLVFYSDNSDGKDSLADTNHPPDGSYENQITIDEINIPGGIGAIYTPVAGQPGFVTGAGGPVTYTFISDPIAATPEPGSLVLLGTGMSGLLAMVRRRSAVA